MKYYFISSLSSSGGRGDRTMKGKSAIVQVNSLAEATAYVIAEEAVTYIKEVTKEDYDEYRGYHQEKMQDSDSDHAPF